MKKIILSLASIALIAGCSSGGADADGDGKITANEIANEMNNEISLEPGEWENSVEFLNVEIEGLPEQASAAMLNQMKAQKTISKSCITEEQAKNPGAEFFAAQEKTNCEVKKFNMEDGTIESAMSCKNLGGGPGNMDMTLTGQYGARSYDMKMDMQAGAAGMKMNISAKNTGKRIGDCPAG